MKHPTKTAETKRETARDTLIRRSVSQGRTVDEIAAAVRAAGLPRPSRASVARDVAALRGRQKVRRLTASAPAPAEPLEDVALPTADEIAATTDKVTIDRWEKVAIELEAEARLSKNPPLRLRAAALGIACQEARRRGVTPDSAADMTAMGHDAYGALCGRLARAAYFDAVERQELPASVRYAALDARDAATIAGGPDPEMRTPCAPKAEPGTTATKETPPS